MAQPRVLVLRAAGVNCDRETAYAFELAGALVETLHVNQFTRGSRRLREFQLLAIPGGFTYGDDVSAGRILSNEMRALMGDQLREFIRDGGLMLGICNGFQALVKAGLLPGCIGDSNASTLPPQSATLAENRSGRFQCQWVKLRVNEKGAPPFLAGMDGVVIDVPIAHGEGRFSAPEDVCRHMLESNQVALQYCGPSGELDDSYNVNGSAMSAAGVSGYEGRILGLMPHPERHVHGTQHPRWTRNGLRPEGDGLRIFRNAVGYLRS